MNGLLNSHTIWFQHANAAGELSHPGRNHSGTAKGFFLGFFRQAEERSTFPAAILKGLLFLAWCIPISGCATGSGIRIWAPATWFSGAAARKVDAAAREKSDAEKTAIHEAHKSIHETQIALNAAPSSRPVEVATASSGQAATLLAQIDGSLTAAELSSIRTTITGLLSENAEVRAEAERTRARNEESIATVSARLAKASAASELADKSLRLAFERENQLANELRSQRALAWILGGVAVLFLAGWVYVRFFLGGLPGAMGAVLSKLEGKNPTAAHELRELMDQFTNRHEQAAIRNEYLKAK